MAKQARRGAETSETRTLLLDVTERLMVEEGYASISSRRVAKGAGVTPALVHYYFGTLDELFLAVLRRRADQQLDRQRRLLETSPHPLRALWETVRDPARTVLVLEFGALANHRKVIRGELGAYAERFRRQQHEVVRARLDAGELAADGVDPMSVVVLINAVATTLVLEMSIDVTLGHAESIALVERQLDRLDGAASPPHA